MIKGVFPIEKFKRVETPFYYYDIELLKKTLSIIKEEVNKYGYMQHYAIKANANKRILEIIAAGGFGADCVSGNEIKAAMAAGFPSNKIVFAGVGKTDKEINTALDFDIFCFNVESLPELEAINKLAKEKGKKTRVALRINPDVDAHTHEYITTGLNENKFGLSMSAIPQALDLLKEMENLKLIGLHFHIGSQITDVDYFEPLCKEINKIQVFFEEAGIELHEINVGGGLGVDYDNPNTRNIPDLQDYFELFHKHLVLRSHQRLHFELGRAVVAQCGSLISRTVFVKQGKNKQFAILDAGMTELIRPALYHAFHVIENITSDLPEEKYDIVGPVCESSDIFANDYSLNKIHRGDIIAIRSAGAYGETMVSRYNCRDLPKAYYSDEL